MKKLVDPPDWDWDDTISSLVISSDTTAAFACEESETEIFSHKTWNLHLSNVLRYLAMTHGWTMNERRLVGDWAVSDSVSESYFPKFQTWITCGLIQ